MAKEVKESDSGSESDNEDVSPIILTPISFRSLVGHDDEVNTCCFSPDWRKLVSGGDDCLVKVWSTRTGQPLHTLTKHKGSVKCCCFSPNGEMFATGSYDHTIIIWMTETGQEVHILQGHSHSVETCCFSNDNLWLCSGSWDSLAIIWSVKTGEALFSCSGHSSSVQCCTFSLDGKYMASGSWDFTVRLWLLNNTNKFGLSISTSPPCKVLQGHQSNVKAVSFSSQGLLASASWDMSIILWDVEMFSILIVLTGHTGWIQACSFSHDGNTLVSASDDQTV